MKHAYTELITKTTGRGNPPTTRKEIDMKRTVEFKEEYIASLCQQSLEDEMLITEDVKEKNGKYVVTYYTHDYEQEGRANRAIRRYTIG